MEWALINGERAKAEKTGQIGICPGCGGEVRAKCGEIVSWHWAHVNADCDPWSEPETEWHRKWKSFFPDHWQEVTKPPHRADVAGPDGVLEIQRSGISPEEIREREKFYGHMAWLLNGHDFWENLEWIKVDNNYYEFRWKHARKTWFTASRAIFVDTPLGLFRIKNIRNGKWKVICGSFAKASKLTESLDKSKAVKPSVELLVYDLSSEEARKAFLCKGEELINLYREYVRLSKTAWPSIEEGGIIDRENSYRCIERCRWSSFETVYDYLLKARSQYIEDTFSFYKQQAAEAQAEINRQHAEEEVKRKQFIEDFLEIRPAPPNGFDHLETAFIQSCVDSLRAAKTRSPQHFSWQ
jgi:competence CoiA-like predicted nuclease